jgi:hypothetical protein
MSEGRPTPIGTSRAATAPSGTRSRAPIPRRGQAAEADQAPDRLATHAYDLADLRWREMPLHVVSSCDAQPPRATPRSMQRRTPGKSRGGSSASSCKR